MKPHTLILGIACTLVTASPAIARRALVTVDGRSMPWDPSVNQKRAFGQGDGQRPVYVWGLKLIPDRTLLFTASGVVTVLPNAPKPPLGGRQFRSAAEVPLPMGGDTQAFPAIGDSMQSQGRANGSGPIAQVGAWGPAGQPYRPANGSIGALGTVFPSYYMPTKSYPVRVNALIGAFVDADGTIVGDPFTIGERSYVTIPKGAAAIALGLNAESYAYNRGAFDVIINTRTPTVTVERVPDLEGQPPE